MGLGKTLKPFTQETIKNKELILQLLKYEDDYYLSNEGQKLLIDRGNNITSLAGSKTIQMMTLNHFGFESDESSLANYRTIFHNYYKSSTDYDKDVLQSVFYMRENRCLYYTTKEIPVGDPIPDVELFKLDGSTKCNLHQIIKESDFDKVIVAGFSMS